MKPQTISPLWSLRELWSDKARRVGIPDLDLFYLEHAEQSGNVAYLQKLAAGLDFEEDPLGTIAAEAEAALARIRTRTAAPESCQSSSSGGANAE